MAVVGTIILTPGLTEHSRFAAVLQDVREARGLTPSRLAKKAGINRQLITNYENGRSVPGFIVLRKIVVALGVEANDLLDIPY